MNVSTSFSPFDSNSAALPKTNSYPGLDANGHTPADVACFNDPSCDQNQRLLDLLYQDVTGTGSGWLPDMTPAGDGIPSWLWLVLAVGGGFFVVQTIALRR